MDNEKVTARTREELGSAAARRMRRLGEIPAHLSGLGMDPVDLAVPAPDFERIQRAGAQLITLEIGSEEVEALVREIQYDAFGEHVLHVDFDRIKRGESIEVDIPLVFFGEPEGATEGGVFQTHLTNITVQCFPRSIPDNIEVDVRLLEVGGEIRARDLILPDEVALLDGSGDEIVAQLVAAVIEEEAEDEEGTSAEPEIIGGEQEEGEES